MHRFLFLSSLISLSLAEIVGSGGYSGWSSWVGGSGGYYEHMLESSRTNPLTGNADYIKKVCVRSGSKVDAIKVWFSSGDSAGYYGGGGGSEECFETKYDDECISNVEVDYGNVVKGMKFTTSRHSTWETVGAVTGGNGDGGGGEQRVSKWFGGGAQADAHWFFFGSSGCLSAIDVEYASLIDRIRVYYSVMSLGDANPVPDNDYWPAPAPGVYVLDLSSPMVIGVAVLAVVLLAATLCRVARSGAQNKYSTVDFVDSDDLADTEAAPIIAE